MKSSLLTLMFFITTNNAFAGANPTYGSFKGVQCRSENGTIDHSPNKHVQELRIERVSPIGTFRNPEFKVTYTPTYLENVEIPKPQVLTSNIWLNEIARSNTTLLNLTNGTNVDPNTGWGYEVGSRLVTTTTPYYDQSMESSVLEFKIVHYQLNLKNLMGNPLQSESFQVNFHPSQCTEIR